MRNVVVALAVLLVASCGGELHADTAIDNAACNSQSVKQALNGLFIRRSVAWIGWPNHLREGGIRDKRRQTNGQAR